MATKEIALKIPPPLNIHPVNTALGESDQIERDKILQLKLLRDNTTILLYQLAGNQSAIGDIFEEHSSVISWRLVGDEEFVVFIHAETSPQSEALLSLLDYHEILLLFPINHLDEGGIEVRLLGEQQALGEFVSAMSELTNLSLERIKNLSSLPDESSVLTSRQREIAKLAFDEGYFDIPRSANTRDLAELLDVTPETIHEHIRKINYRLVKQEILS